MAAKRTYLFTIIVALALAAGCKKEEAKPKSTETGEATGAADSGAVAEGKKVFDQACVACHTVGGGKRTGPDLKGVTDKREADWLKKWMKDPVGMSQNDPIGKQLFEEWNKIPMPNPNLDDTQIDNVLAYIAAESKVDKGAVAATEAKVLEGQDFEDAKKIYFDRCAGCHGLLRAGATGPNIQPKRTKEIGFDGIKAMLMNGSPGGMPAWGRAGILSEAQIELMANYVQMEPPKPPARDLAQITETWDLKIPVADRPTKPARANWENFFGVILRDAGQVAIIDGDSKEKLAIIDTGFAVHILRSSSTGRYYYAVGRDGKVSMIDLWTETPSLVAQVQGCSDARSVDSSKFKGFEDKLLIEGCYWPPQYVVYDGQTLEPKKVQNVLSETYDSKEPLEEVRVAAIIASHYDPIWVLALKESGFVGIVDYSKPDFPMVDKIAAERFLHDGGWDKTQRYFMVAANARDQMAVVDVKERKLVTKFKTGTKPHPGRGANWKDPKYGWVNGTTHIGEGKFVVYGADPKNNPDHAWKVVREIKLDTPGALFVKTHDKSDWVWLDSPLSNVDEKTRRICVYKKGADDIHKCWQAVDSGRAVHFEYNKDGTEVWVSGWDKKGEIVVYNDKDLSEIKRISGDWLVTPTGKFNAYNTAHDVY